MNNNVLLLGESLAPHTVVFCGDLGSQRKLFSDSSASATGLTLVRCSEDRETVLSVCRQLEASILVVRQALIEQFEKPEFIRLTKFGSGTHVLVILEHDSPDATAAMLRLGCRGVLPSSPSKSLLRRAIIATLKGELWAPRLVITSLLLELLRGVSCSKDQNALTPQEQRILELSVQGHKNSDIAAELFISPETVRWHKRRLYRKIGRPGTSRLPKARARPERITVAVG